MAFRTPLGLFVLLAFAFSHPGAAQDGPPVTGDTATFHVNLHAGSNLVALPVAPDSAAVEAVVADLLPILTLVQDDGGRHFVPDQGIADIDAWAWDRAYRIVLTGPATLTVQGPAIQPESSPLLVEHEAGNWIPYLRNAPAPVDSAFASVAPHLLRVEDADGRFYAPGDAASTLDSVRTGHGYKVWVSQPAVLTYPANSSPETPAPDTMAPAPPTGLVATTAEGAIVLEWDDNAEDDLPAAPYEVLRSTTPGGGYVHLAWQSESGYTDTEGLVGGATYYYVVTARDTTGNVSPASAEASATLDLPPPSPGPFALPASPVPTATVEALGLRVAYRDDNRFGISSSAGYGDATEVQGERLWIGTSTGQDVANDVRPPIAVEPNGSGELVGQYLTAIDSTLTLLPPLGTATGTGGYPDYAGVCGEWSPVGGYTPLPSGGSAVTFIIGDNLCSSSRTLRFIQESDGSQRMEQYTLDGAAWGNGNKNHTLESTRGAQPFVAMQVGEHWPNTLVDGDLDGDLHWPVNGSGQNHLMIRYGAVGDTVFIVSNEGPISGLLRRTGPDEITYEHLVGSPSTFWGSLYGTECGTYCPTPRFIGPAGDQTGFVLYTSAGLHYHNGESGAIQPISGSATGAYLEMHGETWRLNGLDVQRLTALELGTSPITPTWVTELTLTLPAGWSTSDIEGWEMTERGSIYLFSESIPALAPSGSSVGDIAVAYYRSAVL